MLARAHASASAPGAPLIVATRHGRGRVVVLADSDLFGDDCIDELDHRALWCNLVSWAATSAPPYTDQGAPADDARHDDAWTELRDETNALAAAAGARRIADRGCRAGAAATSSG